MSLSKTWDEQKKMSLVKWLHYLLVTDNPLRPGDLQWVDKSKGVFKIRWYSYKPEGKMASEDNLFYLYALKYGHEAKDWKEQFRSTLNTLGSKKDNKIKFLPQDVKDDARIYQFIEKGAPKDCRTDAERSGVTVATADSTINSSPQASVPAMTSSSAQAPLPDLHAFGQRSPDTATDPTRDQPGDQISLAEDVVDQLAKILNDNGADVASITTSSNDVPRLDSQRVSAPGRQRFQSDPDSLSVFVHYRGQLVHQQYVGPNCRIYYKKGDGSRKVREMLENNEHMKDLKEDYYEKLFGDEDADEVLLPEFKVPQQQQPLGANNDADVEKGAQILGNMKRGLYLKCVGRDVTALRLSSELIICRSAATGDTDKKMARPKTKLDKSQLPYVKVLDYNDFAEKASSDPVAQFAVGERLKPSTLIKIMVVSNRVLLGIHEKKSGKTSTIQLPASEAQGASLDTYRSNKDTLDLMHSDFERLCSISEANKPGEIKT